MKRKEIGGIVVTSGKEGRDGRDGRDGGKGDCSGEESDEES